MLIAAMPIGATPVAAATARRAPAGAAASFVDLHCSIVDAGTGTPRPTRCKIVDASGTKRYPAPSLCFYHSAGGGYFYSNGSFSCAVPAGTLTLTVKHGLEYREASLPLNVWSDTSIVLSLDRFVSMDSFGWYSGDTHVHIDHVGGYYILDPGDAHLIAEAEGLNIVNCLDNSYCFAGAPDSCSTPDCVVFMSEEMRSASYGHLGLLGLKSPVSPYSSIWWPLAMDIADSAHARRGALVISAHPASSDDFSQVEAWPGNGIARELPIDCIAGRIDGVDVMSYSNFRNGGIDFDLWYRLLNCGFRLPASAGTDAAVNRLDSSPCGAFSVYVQVPGGVFDADGWFEGLAAGRTFVTNGPLVTRFDVGGHACGDSFDVYTGEVVPCCISVVSARPVDRIDIVRNGRVARAMRFEPPRISVDTTFSLPLDESSWIAARVVGRKSGWIVPGDSLVAHTSPVYCTVEGRPILVRDDAAYLAQWIDDLEELARTKGQWADPAQEERVFAELAAARAWYEERGTGSVAGVDGAGGNAPPALAFRNFPNPFTGATVIDFDAGGFSPGVEEGSAMTAVPPEIRADLAIYDVAGRLVRRFAGVRAVGGTFRVQWDGTDERGASVKGGVYFARLAAAGRTFTRKMIVIR
jgi:TolB protein